MKPNDPLGYSGKNVVVCGCYSGIGHATARMLVEQGAKVHGLDFMPCDLPLDKFTQCDLRDPVSINAAALAVGTSIDALFNCAGIAPGRPPLDVMKVNFVGTRELTERLLDSMSDDSAIINVASVGGAGWSKRTAELLELVETEDFAAGVDWCERHPEIVGEGYAFSKEALIVWTMATSSKWINRGTRVNATMPGAVDTPMLVEIGETTPVERIDAVIDPIARRSSADEQARVLLMLGSAGASYMNGAVVPVEGGFLAKAAISAMRAN